MSMTVSRLQFTETIMNISESKQDNVIILLAFHLANGSKSEREGNKITEHIHPKIISESPEGAPE